MQQHQQHHTRTRGLLILSSAPLLAELSASADECVALLVATLQAGTVDEQAFLMKKLGASVVKRSGGEDQLVLLNGVLHLLFEEPERESSAAHLLVPLARIAESLFVSVPAVQEKVTQWLAAGPKIGPLQWMQLAALLAAPHQNLTRLVTEKEYPRVIEMFLARAPVLARDLGGEDDHVARVAGREADAMMSCARDYFPRLIALGLMGSEQRQQLADCMRGVLFACRWTQVQCAVGGMAVAVLEPSTKKLEETVQDESLDTGARLCLCRGMCNSRNHDLMDVIVGHVWPLVKSFLERSDVAKMSTTNRHFLICALDAVARCESLADRNVILAVVKLVIVNFETSAYGPLDAAMDASFRLLKLYGTAADAKAVFALIWNNGRAPLFGPLDHFLQAFGAAFFSETDNFPELLISACGDVRMKTGAIRVFGSFVAAGGTDWEKQLRVAMRQGKNKTLHLCVAQHLIPIVFKTLTVEVAVARLLDGAESDPMLRLAVASHLGNQKRQTLALVIPDPGFVKEALRSGNAWLRRYALETAVAMQDASLVMHYVHNLAKEHSQSQRSNASGVLCRWWKTKVGSAANMQECEDRLARCLYAGSPSARQGTVSAWLATKKSFVSAGRASELQVMLLEMLCSRYDSNRAVAATILAEQFRGTGLLAPNAPERDLLMKLSLQTIKCIRIRVSDGGARLFTLLHNADQLGEALEGALQMLDKHVQIGQRDFAKLASQYTLHGPLLVLRYLLQDANVKFSAESTQRLLRSCRQVMELCSSFVCDNTLEGKSENVKVPFVLEENDDELEGEDDEEEDELSSGSHVRVCAWRGVRETCLAIGAAMQRLLPQMRLEEDVCSTTDALLAIVLRSKHRGALENASIGLEQTCMACLKSPGPARLLPQQWLERVLNFDAKSMGTVRRSAGIPYAICVILRSEWMACNKRDANTPLVSLTMRKLLGGISLGEEEKCLVMGESRVGYYRTQVHHLNILRHVLRDSSLADLLRPYLEELLLLALKTWNHKEWSIRNSASLLFAAAMRKLDPTTTPTSESGEHVAQLKLKKFEFHLFRSNFHGLLNHVAAVLERHASNLHICQDIFSDLFPILLIVKKLHVEVADLFSEKLFRDCVALSAHRNQMIRHGAAKAAAALTEPSQWSLRAAWAISEALNVLQRSTNTAYGLVCCALELGLNNCHSGDPSPLHLTDVDLECVPALCSLRCPPLASVMLRTMEVWRLELPNEMQAQIRADAQAFKAQPDKWALIPGFQKFVSGSAEAHAVVAENASHHQGKAELRLDRTLPQDLKTLVALLDSDEKRDRKEGAVQFQRLFPEHGPNVLHPSFGLSLLFEALALAEFESWSLEWFVSLLIEPIVATAAKVTLVEDLTMKTVFEREDTAVVREPVLLMQLATRQLWAREGAEIEKAFGGRKDAFLQAVSVVVDGLARVQPNPFDMHLWSDLFASCFGAICGLNVLHERGKNKEAALMIGKLKQTVQLPHLLKAAASCDMFWLL